jgi:hypothetical protein
MTAYCGRDCRKCPAFRLPRLGEKLKLGKLAQKLVRRRFSEEPEGELVCDGCTAIDARSLKRCRECLVRCCAMERGVRNCAHCERFPCPWLEELQQNEPDREAETNLRKEHSRCR